MTHMPSILGLFKLALLGAVVATFGDAVHVRTATLSYPSPFLFGQAAFVFPGFFGAFLVMGLGYMAIDRAWPPHSVRAAAKRDGGGRDLVVSLQIFMFVYLCSAFGNRDPLLLAVVFYAAFLIRWWVEPDRPFMLVVAGVLAIAGMAVEGTMAALDLVRYREPEIYGVPWWLGGLYMHGAWALRDGVRRFVREQGD